MKSPSMIHLLALSVFSITLSLSGQAVSIADWQGNKAGAISMTFDDALPGHWSHAAPIMTAAGVRGTFFVITESTDWDGARAAALDGHEIGSHSTDGVRLDLLDYATAVSRMQLSLDAIETQIGTAIPGYKCRTIGWPEGKRRLDVVNDPLYHDLYISARNAGNALGATNSYNAADTTTWWKYGEGAYGLDHYFVIGDASMNTTTPLATFEAQLDLVATQNAWTVFTYHGIETGGYQNISAANFTNQVAALAGRSDDLYIAPYGEVARYVRQRDDATASLVSNDGTTITVSVTDTLDDSVFNLPLTLVIDAPAGWAGAEALQNGSSVPASVQDGKILVNAVPDAGNVTITEGSGPPVVVVPEVTISPLTETSIQLSWETVSGLQYEVMTSTVLSGWGSLDPAIVVNGDDAVHDQEVPYSETSQFYQLSVTTAP